MIVSEKDKIRDVDVPCLSTSDKQRIMDFLQGAVYYHCNTHKDEWISSRDIMGGNNTNDWDKTPAGVPLGEAGSLLLRL